MRNQLSAICFAVASLISPVSSGTGAETDEPKSYPVLSGVGVALAARDTSLYITAVVAESPADRSGMILKGSRLVSIATDGEKVPLTGKTVGEAASLIRGPVGTEITLNVVPPNAENTVSIRLKRAPLELAGVPALTYRAFVGKPVPALTLESLDSDKSVAIADLRGKVIVLDFWASWCPTCFAPVTKMQSIAENNPDWAKQVELVTVTVDSDLSQALAVVDSHEWHSTRNCAIDFNDLEEWGVRVIPLIVVVAPDGTIAAMAGAHAMDVEKEVASLLGD